MSVCMLLLFLVRASVSQPAGSTETAASYYYYYADTTADAADTEAEYYYYTTTATLFVCFSYLTTCN